LHFLQFLNQQHGLYQVAQNFALDLFTAQGQRLRILLLSPLYVVLFKKRNLIFFVGLLLDVIYNVTTLISNWSLWNFPIFLASVVLSNSTIMTALSKKIVAHFILTYLRLRFLQHVPNSLMKWFLNLEKFQK
jgi:hypothetical protein